MQTIDQRSQVKATRVSFLSRQAPSKSLYLGKIVSALACVSLLLYGLASAQAEWLIEYDLGGGSRPCGIIANGTIWFTTVGESRSVIGSIVPSTGRTTKYYLVNQSDLWDLVCGPMDLVYGTSNSSFVWFVQRAGNKIGRLNPRTGESAAWAVPTPGSTPLGIAIQRYRDNSVLNNTLFFTEYDGNRIGALRLIGTQWTFKEFVIPTHNSRPVDITVDNEGYVWFTESAADRIGRLNSTDGTFTEYPVLEGSRPWGITADSRGFIWFTMSEARKIAKLDPRSGLCESFQVPIARSKPRNIKVDSWGSVWFTEYDAGKIVKYLPNYTAFIEYGFPNSDCGPDELALGYQGEVWIAEGRSNKIARVLPSITGTISTGLRTLGIETASSTTFTTPTTVSRLTALTFTSTALTTVTTTVAATVMSTTTATTSITSTTTTTTTPPTVTTTLTVTTTTTPARACIVASAAYESELAGPVRFLRGFRDGSVSLTFAGREFLKTFNAFYYSFSPMIARSLVDSQTLREIIKTLLYPLIGILHTSSTIHSLLAFCPEVAVTVSGLIASFLIGLVYLGPFGAIAMYSKILFAQRRELDS